jgi:cellulose synthase/poly-beta-1,6-N-acetylglucosamine synthase-like glycosyltransferase
MKNIEIPFNSEKTKLYRLFEILPGFLSWTILFLPLILSLISPLLTVFFVIGYILMWFAKSIGISIRLVQGYRTLKRHQNLPWDQMFKELSNGKTEQPDRLIPTWHYENVQAMSEQNYPILPDQIKHVLIVASYNEDVAIIRPTIKSIIDSDFDMKRVMLVMAYEARDGAQSEPAVNAVLKEFGSKFWHAMAVKHPLTEGEVRGKGGNITFAGKKVQAFLAKRKIDPVSVIVTTLDADNRPHPKYLSALSYLYAVTPDPVHVSYQPIPMFTNNIWDASAPMRVIATGNTFWNIVLSLRPHMLRNFSSHAQSMQTLIDTNFWSVRTIVEDGHQFWRTYFRYDGNHQVYPLYIPIYQDAVLAETLKKTFMAQFRQLRRWAYGASDVAYVGVKGFFSHNKVPKLDLTFKFFRLLEGHVSWASAPFVLAFAALIPSQINSDNIGTLQLPIVASRIQTIALLGIVITLYLSLKILPPKPSMHKKHRSLYMVTQWALLPPTTIVFNAFAAFNSQTRLIFGKYLDRFDVTEKAVATQITRIHRGTSKHKITSQK